jgi:prepilin-type N-terminal cleavage/methylation domain-containing protein
MTRRTNVRGFTLLELIAALVLGVLLLAAVAMITRSLATESLIRRKSLEPRVLDNAFELLLYDVTNARDMNWDGQRLDLIGPIERSPLDLEGTLRNANVRYEIRQQGMKSLLIRVQRGLSRNPLEQSASQVVIAEGIDSLQVMTDEMLPTLPAADERTMMGFAERELPRTNDMPLSMTIVFGSIKHHLLESRSFVRAGVTP